MNALVGFVITSLISIFWGGYVTATLWGWFMVPLGVKAITYWHAVGLGVLLSAFLGARGINIIKDPAEAFAMDLTAASVIPAICLVFGWLAKINL